MAERWGADLSALGPRTELVICADDPRVEAIVPIVIDVLNSQQSIKHHAEVYGFWAKAIGAYYDHQILQRPDLTNPGFVGHFTLKMGTKIEGPSRFGMRP